MTTPCIDNLLKRTGRALWLADMAKGLLGALTALVLALGAAVLIDAGFALHRYGLAALDVALIALLLVIVWRIGLLLYRARFQPRRVAVTLEERLSIPDNRIINALDLAQQDGPGFSKELRLAAIAQGEALAQAVAGRPVVDRSALRKSFKPVALAVGALLFGYLLMPSLFHAVVPRLIAPFADHPPFTFVRFDIQTEPGTVYFGQPATIRVTLTGPTIPDEAEIIFVDEGIKSPPLPMLRAQPKTSDPKNDPGAGRYLFHIERVMASRSFYINTPLGRSKLHALSIDTSPQFEQVHIAYRFADYTGWPETTAPFNASGVRALTGTQITLRVTSNVPLTTGELRITDTDTSTQAQTTSVLVVPDPIDPRVAHAKFDLIASGRFELTVQGADAVPGDKPLVGELHAMPDRAPKINIVLPDQRVVVPQGWTIDAQITAGDDIAVGSVVMHHRLNDTPMSESELSHRYTGRDRTVAQAVHPFDLTAIGAKPGDIIHYFATAYDNHPSSAQSAQTPAHTIHVVSMRRYLDLARTRYRIDDLNREFEAYMQQLDNLQAEREAILKQMQALQEALAAGGPLTEDKRRRIDELKAALDPYADQTLSLIQDLRDRSGQTALYGFEAPYKDVLKTIGSQLQPQAASAQSLKSALESLSKSDSAQARSDLSMRARRFELLRAPFTGKMRAQIEAAAQDIDRLRLADTSIDPGEREGTEPGEQDGGAGMSGQMAGMPTLGPAVPAGGSGKSQNGPGGRGGRGATAEPDRGSGGQAEHINADPADQTAGNAYPLPGVPAEYREQAEAYFKRLAEESR